MEKRFYWIKLQKDFFRDNEKIDFLLSQSNGCEYVVIYEMLCLMSCNNNGRLENNVGEIIVPFTVDKLTRDLKYFSSHPNILSYQCANPNGFRKDW